MKHLLLLLLFSTECLAATGKLNCKNTMNVRLQKLPLVITLDSSVPRNQVDAIESAVVDWNAALKTKLIVVADGFLVKEQGVFTKFQQAYTTLVYNNDDIITRLFININASCLFQTDLESLMVHELGHALGLIHNQDTVMNSWLAPYEIRRAIDRKSMDAVRCLYSDILK